MIVFGLPGSVKSYFAKHLAVKMDAVYISSDIVRKEIIKAPTYLMEEKKKVYDVMLLRMIGVAFHKNVVIDATFSDVGIRRKFIEQAKKISSTFIVEVYADEPIIKQRLSLPRENSDADFEVYKKIKSSWQPLVEKHLLLRSSNDNITEMLDLTTKYICRKDGKSNH